MKIQGTFFSVTEKINEFEKFLEAQVLQVFMPGKNVY